MPIMGPLPMYVTWIAILSSLAVMVTGVEVRVACAGAYELWADENMVTADTAGSGDANPSVFTVPASTQILGVKCVAVTSGPGNALILETDADYFTDATWTCGTSSVTNWNTDSFAGSWMQADVLGENVATSPAGPASGIATDVKWIWPDSGGITAYCRGRFSPSGDQPDNAGREFVTAYMDTAKIGDDKNPEMYVTTTKPYNVSVRVTAPGFTEGGIIDHSFVVTAGYVETIVLPTSIRMRLTQLAAKAVSVVATDEVVVFGVNPQKYSSDAFVALPNDVIGTDTYAICKNGARGSLMAVVAAHDNTLVYITLPNNADPITVTLNGHSYGNGDQIVVTLNKYSTLELDTTRDNADLTGAHVISSYPVVVLGGNEKTSIAAGTTADHLVETMFPTNVWGKEFLLPAVPTRTTGDIIRIITDTDNTIISVTGFAPQTLATAGSWLELDVPSDMSVRHIIANEPIMLAQFQKTQTAGEKGDPVSIIVPPIEQFISDYTLTTPKYEADLTLPYDNHMVIIVAKSKRTGVLLDDVALDDNDWTDIDIADGTTYSVRDVSITAGTHRCTHSETNIQFGLLAYGFQHLETYGLAPGCRMAPINERPCFPTAMVRGDAVDNDCDGRIDEELCVGNDADLDGTTDEDCVPEPLKPTCCCDVKGDPHIKDFDGMGVFIEVDPWNTCWMADTLHNTEEPGVCRYRVQTRFGANKTPIRMIVKLNVQGVNYVYKLPPQQTTGNPTVLTYVTTTQVGAEWRLVANDWRCQFIISLDKVAEVGSLCMSRDDANLEASTGGICGNCNNRFDDYYLQNGTSVADQPDKFSLMKESFCQ